MPGTLTGIVTVNGIVQSVQQLDAAINRIEFPFTADGSGNVDLQSAIVYSGTVMGIEYVGVSNLSDGWGGTLNNTIGLDIAAGQLSSLSGSTPGEFVPAVILTNGTNTGAMLRTISDTLHLQLANCGDSGKGKIILKLKRQ